MLVIFIRSIVIYIFLLITMRLMGKKQLGELQPFEFAISLIVADLACIPMSDTSVPMTYGLVPMFTLFVLHLIVTKLAKRSINLRRLINGKPVIVIGANGIDYERLNALDMTTNDLLEALRSNGYFSPSEVMYAIVETNGSLTVLPKAENTPLTVGNRGMKALNVTLPITLISEGKKMKENMKLANISDNALSQILDRENMRVRDVLLLTISGDDIFLQPKYSSAINMNRCEVGI